MSPLCILSRRHLVPALIQLYNHYLTPETLVTVFC
jgi:hypothetical protein